MYYITLNKAKLIIFLGWKKFRANYFFSFFDINCVLPLASSSIQARHIYLIYKHYYYLRSVSTRKIPKIRAVGLKID
jgi:hypothetical protein